MKKSQLMNMAEEHLEGTGLEESVLHGTKMLSVLYQAKPSREVSLAITKVQEAMHWIGDAATRARLEQGASE